MTTIVTRTTVGSNTGKGSPLTHTEVDTNFVNLNTAKLETAAIPLGTLGAPSISFLSYSTTGIYSPAGDELGVSMLGSDKIRIKSTGEIIINATASRTTLSTTPRLQIEGSASSNQCSMSLTGAGAGGTLFPRLHLSKARSSVNAIVLEDDILGFISFNGGDGSSLVNAGFIKAEVDGTPSAGIVPGRLVFATVDTAGSSGERMIIKNNGNVSIDGTTFNVDAVNNRVGIGTSTPQQRLQASAARFTVYAAGGSSGTAFDNGVEITTGDGGDGNRPKIEIKGAGGSGLNNKVFSSFYNNGANESLYFTYAGGAYFGSNVGIGATSVSELLHVRGSNSIGNDATILIHNQAAATSETTAIDFGFNTSTLDPHVLSRIHATITDRTGATASSNLVFSTGSGGTANERARIDSSGRLLVGIIASPAYQLEVSTDSAGKPSTNTWTIVSDERIKEEIELADLDLCYQAVKNIPLKRFKWKDEVYTEEQVKDRRKLGWIAQDVEAVFPKAVGTYEFKYNQVFEETIIPAVEEVLDDEGNVTTPAQPERIEKGELISEDVIEDCRDLNSDQLYAAMYGAIQKLMVKVETLEIEVAALKAP